MAHMGQPSFFSRAQDLGFPTSSCRQRVNVSISMETWSVGVSIGGKDLLHVPRNLPGIWPSSKKNLILTVALWGQCYCPSFYRWKPLKCRKITWLTQGFMVNNSKIRIQASVHLDGNSVLFVYFFQHKTFVLNIVCVLRPTYIELNSKY